MKLTPTKAIRDQCRLFCLNSPAYNCDNQYCVLRQKRPSALKRIRAFCKICAPVDPKTCDGRVLNTEESRNYGRCPLWPFRYGHNPSLKGRKAPEHLKDYYFPRNRMHDLSPEIEKQKAAHSIP